MSELQPWRYECDGDRGARTHYAVRPNPNAPLGEERRDFPTSHAALKFIVRENNRAREVVR